MTFDGFSKDTTGFLSGLSRNNNKAWFDAQRSDYEADFLAPAMAFVDALGPRLRKIDRAVQAVPKVNGRRRRVAFRRTTPTRAS
jgi:uncharacterized protein (DUF2461 family)